MAQSIREKLLSGAHLTGVWLFHNNPVWVEMASSVGVDFIVLDLEHGQLDLCHLPDLLRAASGETGMIVRTQSHDAKALSKMLDMGVDGVIVPKVDTVEQAAKVVAACRYPPVGDRGLAIGAVRASGYGQDADYRENADNRILTSVQIETKAGLRRADDIAAVEGLDMLFVGPNDLTADLGYAAHCDESEAEVTALITRLQASGKCIGAIPYHTVSAKTLTARGVNFVISGSDVTAQMDYLNAFVAD